MTTTEKREYIKQQLLSMSIGAAKNLMGQVIWKRAGNLYSLNNSKDFRDFWSAVSALTPKPTTLSE
jgi:hypothetical protein